MYLFENEVSLLDRLFQVVHTIRPHQIVYQLSLVLLSIFYIGQYSSMQVVSALIVILLITPTFLLVNDVLHKADDEQVGQDRILFSNETNKLLFKVNISIISFILIISSIYSLIFYYLLFGTTLLYGYAKHKRWMYVSYFGRFSSGVFTFLVYYSMFGHTYSGTVLLVALIVGVYDLAGNIAGDLRDKEKDLKTGIKTIVTQFSERKAVQTILYLSIVIYFLVLLIDELDLRLRLTIIVVMFIITIIWLVVYYNIKDRYKHGSVHGVKCLFFVSFGILFSSRYDLLGNLLFTMGSVWSMAYYLYLQK